MRRAAVLPVAVLGLVVLVPLTGLVVATWLAGWRLQPVTTASMEPAYPAGSLLAVQPVDPNEVRSGSVIVFDDPAGTGRLVAHRVIDLLPGAVPTFRTRGDANGDADPYPVAAHAVRGEVRWGVTGLGTATRAFRWPVTTLVLVGVPALLLAGTELAARRRRVASSAPTQRSKPKLVLLAAPRPTA